MVYEFCSDGPNDESVSVLVMAWHQRGNSVTCENHWQIASLVTQKSLFTVTHASFFIYKCITEE